MKSRSSTRTSSFPRFRDRLDDYTYARTQVKVEYIDPDKQPARARQWQVQQYGTVARGATTAASSASPPTPSRTSPTPSSRRSRASRRRSTSSRATASTTRPAPTSAIGYNAIAAALGRDNFAVEKVVLAQQQDVPDDAAVLVIAGPTNDFLQPELDMVQRYLDKGGKLLLMIDPPERGTSPPLTDLIALAQGLGRRRRQQRRRRREQRRAVARRGPVDAGGGHLPVTSDHRTFGVITAFPLARRSSPSPVGRTAGPRSRSSRPARRAGPRRTWRRSRAAGALDEKQRRQARPDHALPSRSP